MVTNISKCESFIESIKPNCFSIETDSNVTTFCNEYNAAAACLEQLSWNGKYENKWKANLFDYMGLHFEINEITHTEFIKDEYDGRYSITMSYALSRLLFIAVANCSKELLAEVNSGLRAALKANKLKAVVDFVRESNPEKILPKGKTFSNDADTDAALMLIYIRALNKGDKMEPGWERTYANEVIKYFPLQTLKS